MAHHSPPEPTPADAHDGDVPRVDPATIAADEASADVGPAADRAPTADEERIADELAKDVSPDVGEHAREMNALGANVRGEGEIVPGE